MNKTPLGQRVARMRKAAGIGARTLSIAVGATHSVVAQIESGRIIDPRAKLLRALACALGTTMEYLLTGEGVEPGADEVREAFDAFLASKAPTPDAPTVAA